MKALFFDIDGTLIDPNKGIRNVPESVKSELQRIKSLGHKLFIATGRPKAMLNEDLLSLPMDGYILYNGGVIEVEDKVIYENKMDYKLAKATCDMLEKIGSDYMLETAHHIYIDPAFHELYDFFKELGMEKMFSQDFDRDEVLHRTIKVEANVKHQDYDLLEHHLEHDFGYMIKNDEHGSDHCFEFYSPTISKALAIERVLNYYQIPKKQSYGFGDGENDIEMFNYVKHSIAMGNASADVMAAADITTDTIENDGLAKILKVLIPN